MTTKDNQLPFSGESSMNLKFSERNKLNPVPLEIYIDTIPENLKNIIWNAIYDLFYHEQFRFSSTIGFDRDFLKTIAIEHFDIRADQQDFGFDGKDWFSKKYDSLEWYEIYDLLEFIINNENNFKKFQNRYESYSDYGKIAEQYNLSTYFNFILERGRSGYRFVSGYICPITNNLEIKEINNCLLYLNQEKMKNAHEHIERALQAFSKKPEADYKVALSESISAVESAARTFTEKNTLSEALKELHNKKKAHPALCDAFIKMYGWTSDVAVRHGQPEQKEMKPVSFYEAKYMIIACSAFCHYMVGLFSEKRSQAHQG